MANRLNSVSGRGILPLNSSVTLAKLSLKPQFPHLGSKVQGGWNNRGQGLLQQGQPT